jgi:hypothetical protein
LVKLNQPCQKPIPATASRITAKIAKLVFMIPAPCRLTEFKRIENQPLAASLPQPIKHLEKWHG